MKTIRSFYNLAEAGFAQSLLESAGIQAALADQYAYAAGQILASGIRLQVPEADAERAVEILDRQEEFSPLPDDFVPPELSLAEAPQPLPFRRSIVGRFITGGFWALCIVGALALVVLAFGGEVRVNVGGLIFLFCLGGIIGLVVCAIYDKGRRDASADRNSAP